MDHLKFKPQPGYASKAVEISTYNESKRALLRSLYDDSVITGRTLEMIDIEIIDSPDAFIGSMIFGIGPDAKQTGIIANSIFPTFFAAVRVFPYLTVKNNTNKVLQLSGGTTPGGTELFSNAPIAANGYTSIALQGGTFTTTVVTPFYLHDGGEGDTWDNISAPGIDVKTNSDPA